MQSPTIQRIVTFAAEVGLLCTLMSPSPVSQAVATDFQGESAAALAAAATRHLQEAEQAKNSGAEHW